MMKKIYYILAAAVTLVMVTACSMKEDSVFSDSASHRSEANIQSVANVLKSASNGWVMEYYGALSMGGYNVLVKFDGSNVTVASEKWGPNHTAGLDASGKAVTSTSHYKLEYSMGTVLSFDGYNPTFHYYSMPNNPDYSYDKAEGLSGDFEFRVMHASADSVILRGKKNNNKIKLTQVPAGKTWEDILNSASATEEYMMSRSYTLAGEGLTDKREIKVTNNGGYRSLVFEYRDDFGEKNTVVAPYIVKEDGYYFYRPVEVCGMVLDGLVKGTTDDYFLFRNNPKLQLDTYMPTLYESITTGNWYQRYGDVGAHAKPFWDALLEKLKTYGKNKDEVKIYYATIGLSSDSKLCSSLTTTTDAPLWGFTAEDVKGDGTRIKFNQASTIKNKAGTAYRKIGWDKVLDCVYGHTFDLTCDYQRRPTWIVMTDVNDPTNVIKVYADPAAFMEDPNYYQDNK